MASRVGIAGVALILMMACNAGYAQTSQPLILLDAHQDALRRVLERGDKLGEVYGDAQGDIPKWRSGGFNAIFFSVWVDPRKYQGKSAVNHAGKLINALAKQAELYPGDLALCDSAAEIRAAVASGRIAALLGIEGGVAIADDLTMLAGFRELGVRYMTLTWRGNLKWAGSSQSDNPKMGLTDFGRDVIREMNRLGIMVDLSHVSDQTFQDVLQVTTKPVIVSHSNARLLSAHPRNVTDGMLRALAANNGVIGVNFVGDFLRWRDDGSNTRRAGPVTVETVVDQIDHIIKVAGIDHVGLGTDYDGGIRPAAGLEHAGKVGSLLKGLMARGYTEQHLRKICGENFLRVMEANER